MSNLEHVTEIIANTKEGAESFLSDIALHDNDFNGENGEEYLWECAQGFESNADYCFSIAEKESTPKAMIEKFIELWMDKDGYYEDYSVEVLQHEQILFVSLVYITEV